MTTGTSKQSLASGVRRRRKGTKRWPLSRSTTKFIMYLVIRLVFLVIRLVFDRN